MRSAGPSVAFAAAFIAVGYFGRRPPAIVIAAVAAVAGILLVDPLVWHSSSASELVPPRAAEECDPGCVSPEAAAILAAVAAACLAMLGILLRRAVRRVRAA
jgi:drug/metabolite transporter (DMT)-like permease